MTPSILFHSSTYNTDYILSDRYKSAEEYPQAVQELLKSVSSNGTILNSTPEKERVRLSFIPQEHSVVKARSDRSIYLISNSQRREIPNMRTFVALGFDLDNVTVLPDHELRLIPLGLPYPEALAR